MKRETTTDQALTVVCRGCGAEPGAWCKVGKVKPRLLVGYVHSRRRAAFRSATGASADQLSLPRLP